MKTNKAIRPMTAGQLKDIVTILINAIPDFSSDEAKSVIDKKGAFVSDIHQVLEKWASRKKRRIVGRKELLAVAGVAEEIGRNPGEEFLTVPEVAAELNRTPVTIYRWIREKRILVDNTTSAGSDGKNLRISRENLRGLRKQLTPMDGMCTVPEAAATLDVSRTTLYRLIKEGKLTASKLPANVRPGEVTALPRRTEWVIAREDVRKLLA